MVDDSTLRFECRKCGATLSIPSTEVDSMSCGEIQPINKKKTRANQNESIR